MKYILLILLAAHCSLFTAYASVFMGGEITWQCLNNGRYRFFMKLYKECGGTNLAYGQVEVMEIINYPALGQTTKVRMGRVSITDDSPVCNAAGPGISCATATLPDKGTVSEYLYSTDSLNPTGYTLSGVPPSEGWIFTYKSPIVSSVTWKRNPSANIQKSDLLTWGLRAIMYPYEGRNADPCYDNSPTFAEKPSTVICTGYPFTYNPNAWDHELDSLVYDWAPPLDSNLSPITSYFPNYSFNSPLPGPAIDTRNVAATINHYTGQISFESFTPGAFVTVSKVSAYKNNILVAEIYREMQIVLLDCGSNKPPVITPPFISKKTGLPAFIDTVYAGQLVKFNLTATDSATQTLTMNASGPDFDPTSIGLSVQCLTPPCATLSPVLPLSGKATISTSFNWQTTCNDLIHKVIVGTDNPNLIYNHPVQSNVHNFVISTQDDFCSVPGKNVSTITVVVLNQPSLPPPSLRCISVNNATGDNTLTWLPITDTSNSFISYNIYYSLNPFGTYSLLSTINDQLTTTFTHVGANGNKQPVYYYMQTKCSCVDTLSIHGDTLSSMFLSLGPSTSVANLSWNPLHPINYQLSTINYVIWREHPIGKWSKLDSITINDQRSTINYNDTIAICTDSINYRIEVTDKSGCTSVSSVAGKQFKDNTAPDVPVLDTVSIDSISKKAIITWHVDPSKDTKKYILYEKINGVWSIVDTIVGRNSTYVLYKKDKFNPYSASEQFCLSAQDSCNNLSPISQNQNTLFLTLAPDICKNAISLSWNSVTPGFSQGQGNSTLAGYSVYVCENNAPNFTLLSTINDIRTTNFTHYSLPPAQYCYYVRAFDNTGKRTSTSNTLCAKAKTLNKPKFTYLRYATVVYPTPFSLPPTPYILICCHTDTTSPISDYIVLRSDSPDTPFHSIATINPRSTINDQLSTICYTDNNVSPGKQSYTYKIEVLDSCGNIALLSNTAKTIYLSAAANDDQTNTLIWNPYQQWDATADSTDVARNVSVYNLYLYQSQSLSDPTQLSFTKAIPPSIPSITYVDNVSGKSLNDGTFYYQVQAIENPTPPFNFQDKSLSNISEAIQNPRFFIPNAFYPNGINSLFKPIGIFYNPTGYYFAIYNRLGVKVFDTSTPDTGWDGSITSGFNRGIAPLGVYAYVLKYQDKNSNHYIKQGTVLLLR